MPTHAKVLTGLLATNVLIGLVPLLSGAEGAPIVGVIIRALLLLGFLKGSEGVRSLLLIGAGVSVIFGAIGVIAGVTALATVGLLGMIALGVAGWSVLVGLYMLFALRDPAVTTWMLNRSLGGALDDDTL